MTVAALSKHGRVHLITLAVLTVAAPLDAHGRVLRVPLAVPMVTTAARVASVLVAGAVLGVVFATATVMAGAVLPAALLPASAAVMGDAGVGG